MYRAHSPLLEKQQKYFITDEKTHDAIICNLQTMSESLDLLPLSLKDRHPDIDWSKIKGFRNILVHDYTSGIDDDLIWSVIENNLPSIEKAIRTEISTL